MLSMFSQSPRWSHHISSCVDKQKIFSVHVCSPSTAACEGSCIPCGSGGGLSCPTSEVTSQVSHLGDCTFQTNPPDTNWCLVYDLSVFGWKGIVGALFGASTISETECSGLCCIDFDRSFCFLVSPWCNIKLLAAPFFFFRQCNLVIVKPRHTIFGIYSFILFYFFYLTFGSLQLLLERNSLPHNTNTTNQMSIFCSACLFQLRQLCQALQVYILRGQKNNALFFRLSYMAFRRRSPAQWSWQRTHSVPKCTPAPGRILWKHNTLQVTDYQLNNEALGKLNFASKM